MVSLIRLDLVFEVRKIVGSGRQSEAVQDATRVVARLAFGWMRHSKTHRTPSARSLGRAAFPGRRSCHERLLVKVFTPFSALCNHVLVSHRL